VPSSKALVSKALASSGLGAALLFAQSRRASAVRVVNYHDVPPEQAGRFEDQLRYFAERFEPLRRADLEAVVAGRRRGSRLGIVLTFDDGLRSHAEVVAPLLERYGFEGWFFVPGGFVDAPAAEQGAFADANRIQHAPPDPADPRLAITWEEARRLAQRHVVGCHTWSHVRLEEKLGAERLREEIVAAKARLEEKLGAPVDSFAWVGGEEWAYSRSGAECIREAGFRYSFMTNNALVEPGANPLQIQRTNVEAFFPPDVVGFQLSGLLDVMYTGKRRRVNRLTA
jgi:peptidoglycan/xylan/chitin deacetylase (PgdA/CDA1 family)